MPKLSIRVLLFHLIWSGTLVWTCKSICQEENIFPLVADQWRRFHRMCVVNSLVSLLRLLSGLTKSLMCTYNDDFVRKCGVKKSASTAKRVMMRRSFRCREFRGLCRVFDASLASIKARRTELSVSSCEFSFAQETRNFFIFKITSWNSGWWVIYFHYIVSSAFFVPIREWRINSTNDKRRKKC